MKTLIIYFSLTGATKIVAKTLANQLNADIMEIKDLKQRNGFKNKITSSIDAVKENKTKIIPEKIDVSGYDLIYIGTPVWASNPAPAIITLIDNCNLLNKDTILFATMSKKGGNSTIERMSEKVKARGARVIETFILKTKDKTSNQIANHTETIIDMLDLNIYE